MTFVLIFLGVLLLANGIYLCISSNMSTGVILTLVAGLFFILFGCFLPVIPLLLCVVIGILVLAELIFALWLYAVGKKDRLPKSVDAIAVLGCGIHGERLSDALRFRLQSALACYAKHKDALIVVCGGQGPQEDITEAAAMERYLLSKGVPAEQIIKEGRSTSTEENLRFGKELLDERLDSPYSIVVVSTAYHIYRASAMARSVGFTSVGHIGAATPMVNIVPGVIRETLAVVKLWVLGR